MQVTFVGHASVLVEAGGVGLLTDPWLRGDAFNDSWTPYPAPQLADADLDRVTHLWVSHEHPDHLSVPTLRSIPAERRSRITALYQRHWSPVVADFLRTLGFADVVELPHGRWQELAPGVEVTLYQVGHEDAALAVRSGGRTVLDLNDCKPSRGVLGRLRRHVGPVDVLLDQFSVAGWPGNPDEPARLEAAGERALGALADHVAGLDPAHVVPFASFVRFSHVDNAFANAAAVPVARVGSVVPPERLAVLYPGDRWDVGRPWDGTADALRRYAEADAARADQPLNDHPPVAFDEVLASARTRLRELEAHFHHVLLGRVGPVTFDVTDAGRAVEVSPRERTVREVPVGTGACRVELTSQAASYTFAHRWGLPTLLISGRFRLRGDERPFRRLKQLGALDSGGMHSRGIVGTLADRRVAEVVLPRWQDLGADLVARAA